MVIYIATPKIPVPPKKLSLLIRGSEFYHFPFLNAINFALEKVGHFLYHFWIHYFTTGKE